MTQSLVWSAFIAGIISSFSMPLGAVTSLFWNPKNRVLAFLMAFGAGALLSALVIDLVGSARSKGHILELIVGSVVGSLFFTFINQIVNNSGGFLRKSSTTLVHLSQKQSQRFTQRINQLKRTDLFRDLPLMWRQELANKLLQGKYPHGTTIYRQGDPSESLYIIDKGKVDLLNPQDETDLEMHLGINDTFGKLAFLTGSPHQSIAITREDTQLSILTRGDFEDLLEISPELGKITTRLLQSEEIGNYLQEKQGLSSTQVQDWVDRALVHLKYQREILPAVTIEQKMPEFLKLSRQIRRFEVFSYLPEEDLENIASRLVYKRREDGFVFFQPQDLSDRLYIIHQGEIEILFPSELGKSPIVLSSGDAVGELSFVTKSAHTVTAIAKTDVAVWVLRQQDFDEMLQQSPGLETAVKTFLAQPKLKNYLETRQHFSTDKTKNWIETALKQMNAEHLLPSAKGMAGVKEEHKDAPMAIWLGLLMDGIPEALTIGAHLASHPLSASLLAGLFISNYPEALSSSEGMKQQGFAIPKILIMWTSIMLITGILAGIGSVVFADAPESIVSLLESMAAGAMLTVISETMLPESYAKGGAIVGLSTLLGFLVIIVIKTLDSNP